MSWGVGHQLTFRAITRYWYIPLFYLLKRQDHFFMRMQRTSFFRLHCQKMLSSITTGFLFTDTVITVTDHITFSVWPDRFFRANSWHKCTQHLGVLASLGALDSLRNQIFFFTFIFFSLTFWRVWPIFYFF